MKKAGEIERDARNLRGGTSCFLVIKGFNMKEQRFEVKF
jgi:hypothetical protein